MTSLSEILMCPSVLLINPTKVFLTFSVNVLLKKPRLVQIYRVILYVISANSTVLHPLYKGEQKLGFTPHF